MLSGYHISFCEAPAWNQETWLETAVTTGYPASKKLLMVGFSVFCVRASSALEIVR